MKIFCLLVIFCLSRSYGWDYTKKFFPVHFRFGVATSAYQIEGAWDKGGKGESIWDRYVHTYPELVVDGRNGDNASDSYHLYKRDVEMLREMGIDYYRFSISWPRVLPNGFANKKNEEGMQYYDNVLDELIKHNIEPMVTMFHYDLPQKLQDLGGWANPDVVQWFVDYAKVLFDRYAHKVKYWVTVNQPSMCFEAYGDTKMAPAIGSRGIGDYMCVKNMMVAHARVYRLYEKKYKPRSKGMVGMSVAVNWVDPIDFNKTTENEEDTELFRDFTYGLYLHPIWNPAGDFPPAVKAAVAKRSKAEGYSKSRLPQFTAEEIKMLRNASDFLGVNHYTTYLVKHSKTGKRSGLHYSLPDIDIHLSQGEQWVQSKSAWLKAAPYGIYKSLVHLSHSYNQPLIIVTEFGWSTGPGLNDTGRVTVMKDYCKALLFSMEDGADVRGITMWTLMDNIQWTAGTSERFGLYEVNFDSPDKRRSPRASAHFYKHMIHSRIVDEKWKLDTLDMEISNRRADMKGNTKSEL